MNLFFSEPLFNQCEHAMEITPSDASFKAFGKGVVGTIFKVSVAASAAIETLIAFFLLICFSPISNPFKKQLVVSFGTFKRALKAVPTIHQKPSGVDRPNVPVQNLTDHQSGSIFDRKMAWIVAGAAIAVCAYLCFNYSLVPSVNESGVGEHVTAKPPPFVGEQLSPFPVSPPTRKV